MFDNDDDDDEDFFEAKRKRRDKRNRKFDENKGVDKLKDPSLHRNNVRKNWRDFLDDIEDI